LNIHVVLVEISYIICCLTEISQLIIFSPVILKFFSPTDISSPGPPLLWYAWLREEIEMREKGEREYEKKEKDDKYSRFERLVGIREKKKDIEEKVICLIYKKQNYLNIFGIYGISNKMCCLFAFLLMIEEKKKVMGSTIILSLFSNSLQTKKSLHSLFIFSLL
jgi:hypothetical protein